jgi:MscS family membrane protein
VLAAQDYLKNLLAGFNNAAERRFREGDWISVEGLIEGTVESVDLRSTLVRRFDKAPVYVPNSELANGLLINFSRCPHRRIRWKISLTYATSVDTLRIIRERIEQHIDESDLYVNADLAARYVRIESFNDSSIDMLVLCFSQSNVWADYLEAKEELALAIKTIVGNAGGDFAFPSRSIYMETSDEATPGSKP